MLHTHTINRYLDTVWAIAASKYCQQFIIGYTARSGRQRLLEYRYNHRYQHLVVLADHLNRKDALALEGMLQNAIKEDKRHTLYRKYCPDRRDKRHFPSAGQATSDPAEPVHSVYMAWWENMELGT